MDPSSCPFCDEILPSSELQRHANSHFEGDDQRLQLATDLELAQQISLFPPSPSGPSRFMNDKEASDPCDSRTKDGEKCNIDKKVSCLINLQNRSPVCKVEPGLMILLRHCLEFETDISSSILSGYIDHYQSVESEDAGWGCGWRNIQMLSSHLLKQRKETREVLFGGSNFVPDIPSLQRWLEIAWERGFDTDGSEHFDCKIYGKKCWVGTTECAALFRSFGLQARIVDFGPKESESLYLSVPGSSHGISKRKAVQIYGPMDRFLSSRSHDVSHASSSGHEKPEYCDIQHVGPFSSGNRDTKANSSTKESGGTKVLIDWVWNYFSDEKMAKHGHRRVNISEKSPLYFQHDGHSRTIVGIQVKHPQKGQAQYNLLILDPAHRTEALERSLKENNGWQKLVKRGVHTLKKPQYQLCYIDPGITGEVDTERLKTIDSIFLEL